MTDEIINDKPVDTKPLNEVEELNKQLEETKAKAEEYLNGWKRERADFINYKKDEMEKIGSLIKYANEELILNLIPVLDNIYLAEAHIPEEFKTHKWIEGFGHIKTQLVNFLKKEGIEEIKTTGEVFDPNTMEAVEKVDDASAPSSDGATAVAVEVQKGYTLHEKVIKVAKVKISK